MELAERRDDGDHPEHPAGGGPAAMEPAAERRDDAAQTIAQTKRLVQPQWSPPLSGGTT